MLFVGLGVGYAAVAGFITIPGVPALLADQVIQPPTRPIATPTPTTSSILEETPSPVLSPDPSSSSTPSPEFTASPAASVSPTPSPTPDATALAKQRDDQRLNVLVPKLQVALKDYQKKHGSYPKSLTYADSWTTLPNTPLKVLVAENFIDALPADPSSDRKIGYRSVDGKSYAITVSLEDTTHPGGVFITDSETGTQLYVYTVSYP